MDGDLSATEVLREPSARQAATRWRSGSGPRQITAALARLTTSLQGWMTGPRGDSSARLTPVHARPLQDVQPEQGGPSLAVLFGRLRALRWRTWLACFLTLCFLRAVALIIVLACRYFIKGVVALVVYFGRELLSQLALTVHEVEDSMVAWMSSYLHTPTSPLGYGSMFSSPVPPERWDASATPLSAPPPSPETAQPTRPLDVLTVLLLALNLLRGQPGWVGVNPHPQGPAHAG